MCGIAGIIHKNDEPVREEHVRRMLMTIKHRGPDAEGIVVFQQVGLGHRRLSIIDTSASANQPMHYNQFTITYNGEIYNYIELKEELEQCGHHFTTQSDTEVILHSYAEWGNDCFKRFIGMWALAIYDQGTGQILLSRDRFGIKPLYYVNEANRFIFASEIKALLSCGVPRYVNYNVMLRYLVLGLEDTSNETFFQGIYQVQPGEMSIYDVPNNSWNPKTYYVLTASDDSPGIEGYNELFAESVRVHLRSDVPVGTCLSGGLDSSTVAALASRVKGTMGNERFVAVTAQSEAPVNDETPYARKVVEYCKLDWHVTMPKYDDFERDIAACLHLHDEPVGGPSVYMQYCVMREARACGLKVVLDGQGGDETLLGYERYYAFFLFDLVRRRHWNMVSREYLGAAKNSRLTHVRLLSYVGYFLIPFLRKTVALRRFNFLKPEHLKLGINGLSVNHLQIADMQISEIIKDQLPHLLRYEDRNSMAHSIEARVPFLDHRCVEAAIALLPSDKIRDGFTKYPLRLLAETLLPSEIAWRRNKFGFEAPDKLWLNRFSNQMEATIRSSEILHRLCRYLPSLGSLSSSIGWRLYNIALWEQQHNVSA